MCDIDIKIDIGDIDIDSGEDDAGDDDHDDSEMIQDDWAHYCSRETILA